MRLGGSVKQLRIETAIIKAFKSNPDGFVSGESLAAEIGVSRAAVWKKINLLREKGYEIEAVPRLGYRLASKPDVLLSSDIRTDLKTGFVGHRIVQLRLVESTNEKAKSLAAEGAENGTMVIAEEQLAGKGRLSRKWTSPPGGLWLSIILRPELPLADAPKLSIAVAVAVAKTISLLGLKPQIKWPNDILIKDKKVCGVLIEMTAQLNIIEHIIMGIGINVNNDVLTVVEDNRNVATSLSIELNKTIDRTSLLAELAYAVEEEYLNVVNGRWEKIKNEWLEFCNINGKQIIIKTLKDETVGSFAGIDETGALLLLTETGVMRSFSAGDVSVLK
jgi:BirA family transcriptional regulator, biotin operon repressor / biotin---[acetyl-CoA-carboxylase] ligase